jgi:hypothetical protein
MKIEIDRVWQKVIGEEIGAGEVLNELECGHTVRIPMGYQRRSVVPPTAKKRRCLECERALRERPDDVVTVTLSANEIVAYVLGELEGRERDADLEWRVATAGPVTVTFRQESK